MKIDENTKRVAQEALDYILMHPEKHDQDDWISSKEMCDTQMCVAGTVMFNEVGILKAWDIFKNSESKGVQLASDLLGLDDEEASRLFYCFDKERALDKLNALAQGDENKFNSIEVVVDY